jgi:hypothetical protein
MKMLVFTIMVLIFSLSFTPVQALQQVAGKLEANLVPGQSATVEWGLISDNTSNRITIELYAEGLGSAFLSFPEKVDLDPKMIKFIPIVVTIPDSFSEKTTLNPTIYAVEKGQEGGPTVINIQMKKVMILNIDATKQITEESEKPLIQQDTQVPKDEKMVALSESESVCGEGTVLKEGQCVPEEPVKTTTESKSGGGCLIATATYGSEMVPQVQFLREIRDNTVLSTQSGASFMSAFNAFYYSFSPVVADMERQNPVFKEAIKATITPLLTSLTLLQYVDIDTEEEMLGYGIGIILLNIGMYFVAPVLVILKIKSKFRNLA